MFKFLLGGIYLDEKVRDNSYYVNSFGLDYAAGILPALARAGGAIPAALPPILFGSPFYRNDEDTLRMKSYGLFGETSLDFTDTLQLTLGFITYHHDTSLKTRTPYLTDTT